MASGSSSRQRNIKTVESLLRSDGSWADCPLFCCPAPKSMNRAVYFRSYEDVYHEKGVIPPKFDANRLHERWGKHETLKHRSTFLADKWGKIVNGAFQIGGGYEWRMPTFDERLYSRPVDGCVAIPLETFKAGLRP